MGMRCNAICGNIIRGSFNAVGGFFLSSSGYVTDIQSERHRAEEDEDEDSRTEIVYSVSEIGDMVDFLKAYPFVSLDDYKWGLSVPMIRLMTIDNTQVHYLSEKQAKRKKDKFIDGSNLTNDLGIPIFK